MTSAANSSQDAFQLLVQTISDLQVFNLVSVASLALMVYDCAICLSTEYRLIWKSKWTRGKFLYLGCRYTVPVLIASCLPMQLMTDCPLPTAKAMYESKIWMAVIINLIPHVLMSMRTYAVYCGNKIVKWLLVALFFAEVITLTAVLLILSTKVKFSRSQMSGIPCILSISYVPQAPQLVSYIAAVSFAFIRDMLLVISLLRASVDRKKALMWIIFRNGICLHSIVQGAGSD
ncbi:hypothetical protein DFH11DRAFT_1171397 [Phellopilus nigrolimitatus]|nr:hypothetical protein DFH11DRAFT_1171397 [Phellopilus nigrolimitatus]